MKLGLNLWIWESPFRTEQHLPLFAKLEGLGAQVVEIGMEDDATLDPKAIRNAMDNHGLECTLVGLFGPRRDLSSEDASVRHNGMDYAKRCLDTAAEVGSALYSGAVVGVGGNQPISENIRQERLRLAAESLRVLGDYAARRNIAFCVEVLNRYESNFINTAEEARHLIDLTNHPAVGIHLDLFHMSMEERNLGDAIRIAGDRLFHLHASESHRGTPGDGLAQWPDVAAALKEVCYRRAVVIESFNPSGRLAPLARFWRRFANSPDHLAQNGLAFLRKALLEENNPAMVS